MTDPEAERSHSMIDPDTERTGPLSDPEAERSHPMPDPDTDKTAPMTGARPLFTNRELDVMSILWRTGSGTVAEVKEELGEELAYTSVLSVLQTLEDKGFVRHESEGRAYRYFARVAPEEAGGSALERIREAIYHGSSELLFAQLVSDRRLGRGELERMRRLLAERLEEES
jgi:BlaI family transcriptional regulator, penicillinase repressor